MAHPHKTPGLRPRIWPLALLVAAVGAPSALAAPYTVDPARSDLTVKVKKAGLLSGLAHDHLLRATKIAGRIDLDPLRPAAATVSFEVAAGSLRVEDKIDADDKASIKRSMDEQVLRVRRHPTIRFLSKKVKVVTAGREGLRLKVAGLLTLRGKTRGIVLDVRVVVGADGALTARGAYRLRQSDYGIEPFSAFLGAVTVKDDVDVSFRITARPDAPPAPKKPAPKKNAR